jgi:hypothetical protein
MIGSLSLQGQLGRKLRVVCNYDQKYSAVSDLVKRKQYHQTESTDQCYPVPFGGNGSQQKRAACKYDTFRILEQDLHVCRHQVCNLRKIASATF